MKVRPRNCIFGGEGIRESESRGIGEGAKGGVGREDFKKDERIVRRDEERMEEGKEEEEQKGRRYMKERPNSD